MNKILTPEIIKLYRDAQTCWDIIDKTEEILSVEDHTKLVDEWCSMRDLIITLIKENCHAN